MLHPGDRVTVSLYGGNVIQDATVLAVRKYRALIEHEGRQTSLCFTSAQHDPGDCISDWTHNPYGYERLPLMWLRAIGDRGWIGRSRSGQVPQPLVLLEQMRSERPTTGWEQTETGWRKVYHGHRLRILRQRDALVGYVGNLCAGHHHKTASGKAFGRVCSMTHDLAHKVGKGIRDAS